MKLSKVLAATLITSVGFTATAMASGTKAGTKISNQPVLEYSFGAETKTAKAPEASYVVDKVINFTVELKKDQKQKVIVGKHALGEFVITNKGNSVENFVLSGNYGSLKDFKFSSSKIYIDKNNNGVLDKSEMKHTPVLSKLAIDGKKTIWIDATTDIKTVVGKGNHFGLLARATAKGLKEIYTKQSTKNSMSKVDIIFADGAFGGDKVRDNQAIIRYIWTTVKSDNNVKLSMNIIHNVISADPINGVCKNLTDAKSGKYKAIPGATNVRAWSIENKTKEIAKSVKFSIKLNSNVEKIATSSAKTWWKNEKRVHILWTSKGVVGEGKYNAKTNSVDFVIKEIKPGETYYPHIVTEIK
jgi:hypothetical protein